MKDFRDLKVWEKSHGLALRIHQATRTFPREELYGLTSQIRRSSQSIPTNIAEGCGRGSDADFARFLQIAMGSACEIEYQLLLAHDLGYVEISQFRSLTGEVTEVKKMLTALIQKIGVDRARKTYSSEADR